MRLGPLMLDLQGLTVDAEERELLAHPAVGAVILFARNVESPAQIKALCDEIHRAAKRHLLIAVDQEGGRVQRFREGFSKLPPLRDIQDEMRARELGWLMAAEVRAVGCDISFAPVLDLDFGQSEVIGNRSFGRDPAQVVSLAQAYLGGMREAGMLGTGKHFPGHGFVAADSHIAVPVDERTLATIAANDLSVFKQLSNDLGAVMPAHVIYPQVDALPAGFSPRWLQQILRRECGFKGCIFSDDLAMAGAHVVGDYTARARAALAAGCDMILVCNDRKGAIVTLESLPQNIPLEQAERIEAMCARAPSLSLAELQKTSRYNAAHAML